MKRAYKMKHKAFFIIFEGLSVAKNCLRPESVSLICRYSIFGKHCPNKKHWNCVVFLIAKVFEITPRGGLCETYSGKW